MLEFNEDYSVEGLSKLNSSSTPLILIFNVASSSIRLTETV